MPNIQDPTLRIPKSPVSCSGCGCLVAPGAIRCPRCGALIEAQPEESTTTELVRKPQAVSELNTATELPADARVVLQFLPSAHCVTLDLLHPVVLGRGALTGSDGLIDLTVHDAFWPKLALYIFHFAGLILGALGMWLTRANWRVALPLLGFILYTTLVHLVLLATPRYIFPVELFWWVFAAAALIAIRDAWKARRTPAQVVVRSTRIAE